MFAFPSIRSSMRLRSSGRCEPSMSISQISVYPWSSAHVKPSTYAEPSPSLPLRCSTNTRESIVQPLMRFAIFRSGVLTCASESTLASVPARSKPVSFDCAPRATCTLSCGAMFVAFEITSASVPVPSGEASSTMSTSTSGFCTKTPVSVGSRLSRSLYVGMTTHTRSVICSTSCFRLCHDCSVSRCGAPGVNRPPSPAPRPRGPRRARPFVAQWTHVLCI